MYPQLFLAVLYVTSTWAACNTPVWFSSMKASALAASSFCNNYLTNSAYPTRSYPKWANICGTPAQSEACSLITGLHSPPCSYPGRQATKTVDNVSALWISSVVTSPGVASTFCSRLIATPGYPVSSFPTWATNLARAEQSVACGLVTQLASSCPTSSTTSAATSATTTTATTTTTTTSATPSSTTTSSTTATTSSSTTSSAAASINTATDPKTAVPSVTRAQLATSAKEVSATFPAPMAAAAPSISAHVAV